MADAEYIEITSSDISQAQKDLEETKIQEDESEVTSDDTPSEIEIIDTPLESSSEEISNGEVAEVSKAVTQAEGRSLDSKEEAKEGNRQNELSTQEEDQTEISSSELNAGDTAFVDAAPVFEAADSSAFEEISGPEERKTTGQDSQMIQKDRIPSKVVIAADSGAFEEISGPEERKTTGQDIQMDEKDRIPGKVVTDDKPSPLQRFRSFTKPEKKDKSTASSINLPSIFSNVSTSFMSLKNIGRRKESASEHGQGANKDTTPSPVDTANVEQLRIKRKNLLGMAKLSIKGLIESSLGAGHTLDSDHAPLQQFFVIMESVLRHGLKSPKLFFTGNKNFWGPLEAIEKIGSEAAEITNSVRELPGIKTHLGRARAWLRLALMQKRLADYFRMLVEHRDIMREFYEVEALVLSEEGIVLSGHLVGLNCIDANLCMKGDDLDNQNLVIDYSLYVKAGNRSINSELNLVAEEEEKKEDSEKSETVEDQIGKLANQKNYLEERNRHLETTLSELQKRAGHTSSSNQLLETELEAAKISVAALRQERDQLVKEKEDLAENHKMTLNARQADLNAERDTLVKSRAGLDEMFSQVKKQLKQEAILRMDVERELELQISSKQELEVAMKLLEKEICDKQDSLVILREQLDNVKRINIEVYKELKDQTDDIETKGKAIQELKDETKRLNIEVTKLKEKVTEANQRLDISIERAERFSQNLDDSEKRRNALDTNLKIEREWRMALEKKDEKSTNQITQLQTELSMMQLLKQELEGVKNERNEIKMTCDEQESTINDLADHLGKSKENFQNLKDVHKTIADKTWEEDREVRSCLQCGKPFNLSRRKHHCRNCGQIYCNTCSDNTMPLALSAKPVRVCDACHTLLLQRYNAATP